MAKKSKWQARVEQDRKQDPLSIIFPFFLSDVLYDDWTTSQFFSETEGQIISSLFFFFFYCWGFAYPKTKSQYLNSVAVGVLTSAVRALSLSCFLFCLYDNHHHSTHQIANRLRFSHHLQSGSLLRTTWHPFTWWMLSRNLALEQKMGRDVKPLSQPLGNPQYQQLHFNPFPMRHFVCLYIMTWNYQ